MGQITQKLIAQTSQIKGNIMSINKTIKVENHRHKPDDVDDLPAIDKSQPEAEVNGEKGKLEKGSHEGRKHKSDIDGPQQASQETDDIYDEERETDASLPRAGKNVGELNAFDLGRHDKD